MGRSTWISLGEEGVTSPNLIDLSVPDVVGNFKQEGYPINTDEIEKVGEYRLPKLAEKDN